MRSCLCPPSDFTISPTPAFADATDRPTCPSGLRDSRGDGVLSSKGGGVCGRPCHVRRWPAVRWVWAWRGWPARQSAVSRYAICGRSVMKGPDMDPRCWRDGRDSGRRRRGFCLCRLSNDVSLSLSSFDRLRSPSPPSPQNKKTKAKPPTVGPSNSPILIPTTQSCSSTQSWAVT
jgi:hypothetical protein